MDEYLIVQHPHYVAVWQRVQSAFSNSRLSPSFHAALSGTAFQVVRNEAVEALGQEHMASIQMTIGLSFDSLVAEREGATDLASTLLDEASAGLD